MTVNAAIREHGVRLLNPFRGVMNIIEYKGAEAVTIDAVNCDIYVKDLSLTADLQQSDNMLLTDISFVHWSKNQAWFEGLFILLMISTRWSNRV